MNSPNPLLWCFHYEDYYLAKKLKTKALVLYDCVDYFTSVGAATAKIIKREEDKLMALVDYIFVNSRSLKKVKLEMGKDIVVVPQGFDEWSFRKPSTKQKEVVQVLKNAPSPRVVFVGNMTYRMDIRLLHKVVRQNPKVSFVFVGPFSPIEPEDTIQKTVANLNALTRHKNVLWIDHAVDRTVVKYILEHSDIGMIPYNTQYDFNLWCFPMKVFEYFYMGKPVVATSIHELSYYPRFIKIGDTAASWNNNLRTLLGRAWPKSYKREQRDLAIKNNWSQKVSAILRHIG